MRLVMMQLTTVDTERTIVVDFGSIGLDLPHAGGDPLRALPTHRCTPHVLATKGVRLVPSSYPNKKNSLR